MPVPDERPGGICSRREPVCVLRRESGDGGGSAGLSPFWGSDLLTGIGDGASGGIARPIRSWIGHELGIGDPNAYVDTDSWWYKGGSIGGSVLGMATGTSQVGMAAGLANMQAGQAAAGTMRR